MKKHGMRIVASVLRTLAAVLIFWLTEASGKNNPAFSAMLTAILAADILSWAVKTAMELPRHMIEGAYDIVLNFVIVAALLQRYGLALPREGDVGAVAGLVFVGTLTMKAGYYCVEKVLGRD